MKPGKFSIGTAHRLEYQYDPVPAGPDRQNASGSSREGSGDYFLNPDRFFSRIYSRKPGYGVPLLVVLLSLIPPVLAWWILAAYYDSYVPYWHHLGSGAESLILLIIGLLWLLALIYFPFFTDFPESLFIEYECRRMWRKRAIRIFPALSWALLPLIVCQIIGVIVLGLILPSVIITPPPTSAYTEYKDAEAAHYSIEPDFSAIASGSEPHEKLLQRLDSARVMMMKMSPAEDEAAAGTKQVTSQLMQDSVIRTFGWVMAILLGLTLLWTGILLTLGIRHALDISLEASAVLTGFFICGFSYLTFFLARLVVMPLL